MVDATGRQPEVGARHAEQGAEQREGTRAGSGDASPGPPGRAGGGQRAQLVARLAADQPDRRRQDRQRQQHPDRTGHEPDPGERVVVDRATPPPSRSGRPPRSRPPAGRRRAALRTRRASVRRPRRSIRSARAASGSISACGSAEYVRGSVPGSAIGSPSSREIAPGSSGSTGGGPSATRRGPRDRSPSATVTISPPATDAASRSITSSSSGVAPYTLPTNIHPSDVRRSTDDGDALAELRIARRCRVEHHRERHRALGAERRRRARRRRPRSRRLGRHRGRTDRRSRRVG